MAKLRVGFIGAGFIAGVHAERLSKFEEIEIVAFTDIVREKAQNLASKYGGNVYTDYHEMFSKEKLDAVYICIPPFAHKDEVMIAAENGIHVFIEKPIALDLRLAEEMVKSVEKNGVKSQVGYVFRFTAGISGAKRLIESGDVGKVLHFQCAYLGNMLFLIGKKHWWKDESKGGGHIVEQVTHVYDTVRYLLGEADEVFSYTSRFMEKVDPDWRVEDGHVAVLKMRNGAIVSMFSSACYRGFNWLWRIICEKAVMELPNPHKIMVWFREKDEEKIVEKNLDFYAEESRDFINAILNDRDTKVPIREGYNTLKLTLAVKKAAKLGKPIKLDEL